LRPAGTIEAELAARRLDARFTRSRGCTDVTVADSRALCAEVAVLEGEKANATQAERLKGKIGEVQARIRGMDVAAALRSADPQAEQLAALTGLSQDAVRLWMAIILSIMIELGSSLLLDVAAVAKRKEEGSLGPVQAAEEAGEAIDTRVDAWAMKALQAKRGGSIRCTDAREAFERHVRAAGSTPPAANAFGRAMTAMGHRRKKKAGHFHYVGIALCQPGLKVVS
jgi:hypothetical protein